MFTAQADQRNNPTILKCLVVDGWRKFYSVALLSVYYFLLSSLYKLLVSTIHNTWVRVWKLLTARGTDQGTALTARCTDQGTGTDSALH